jgi:small ligand-binding sensory domain FIST
MTIATATSQERSPLKAASEVVKKVKEGLRGTQPDLAFLFASRHHASEPSSSLELEEGVSSLARELSARHLAGLTAESIIGGRLEYEEKPAFTLWAAALPEAQVSSGHILFEPEAGGVALAGLPEIPSGPATMLLLADPYTFPADHFLVKMAEDYPELLVLGGMASGASAPGESCLFWNGEPLREGAVGLVVSGGVRVRALVSQGCRPFGKHLVITKADRNCIYQLGGKPALEKLAEQVSVLTIPERSLLQRGLHLGLAIDAKKREHRRGDFLVRNVIGFVKDQGAILVTDVVRPGMTVQFHLRDAETASEDLQLLLKEARASGAEPLGGLLFSCNGRGSRMFEVPHHDAGAIAQELGELPLAGFFAAGEIGPIGGKNFLHGFTASLALFEEAG